MFESSSNPDSALEQRIQDLRNLAKEIQGHESANHARISKVLMGLLPEVEYRNGNLDPAKKIEIAELIAKLTDQKMKVGDHVRDFILKTIFYINNTKDAKDDKPFLTPEDVKDELL